MASAWIEHVKLYQRKHNCSYKEAMKRSSATYKKKQKHKQAGGNLAGDITRLSVAAIRKGMKAVPLGDQVMSGLNPLLDTGLSKVGRWEKGSRPVDHMTQEEKDAAWRRSKRRR